MVVLGGGRFLVSEVPLHMVGMVAAIREEAYFLFASRLGSFGGRCVADLDEHRTEAWSRDVLPDVSRYPQLHHLTEIIMLHMEVEASTEVWRCQFAEERWLCNKGPF